MAGDTVLVLGGGIGGLVAARRLRSHLPREDRVVLVERDLRFRFAPSFLWVMTGFRRPEKIVRDLGRLRRHGIEVVQAEALGIDAAAGAVETTIGAQRYDRLVIALGVGLAPDALPGFQGSAHNVYSLDGAFAAHGALRGFAGGHVVVLVSRLPYKCPAGPHEAAFLAEAQLRRLGVRERSSVTILTPEPQPMPTAGPEVGTALARMLDSRGIVFRPGATAREIDGDAREIALEDGERVPFDLLLGIPPHAPPLPVRESGLAADSGFLPVDRNSLAVPGAEGVFAIGDVTAIPIAGGKMLPKAGVFAFHEAEVVARRIADDLAGRTPSAEFEGRGSCFVELGDGRAAFARGAFYADGAPEVDMPSPGRRWHLQKMAFERYWLSRWF